MPPRYRPTLTGITSWAEAELQHVGRIAGVEDPDLQYAYAQSTVNGMLHLRDAILELVNDPNYQQNKEDLQRLHDTVVRVIKHLISDYDVNIEEIKVFNTRQVLGNLSYLENSASSNKFAINNSNNNVNTVKYSATGGAKRKTRKARTKRNIK